MQRVSGSQSLPAVGVLINRPEYSRLTGVYSRSLVIEAIREQVAAERESRTASGDQRLQAVEARLRDWTRPQLRRVINATGVVLHTNLGRAPLSTAAAAAAAGIAAGYSNLELDLGSGRRGKRGESMSGLLQRLLGAPAALVVNNNAAAILLALTALCRGRQVIISRGQLVEIGGAFRMPDVMRLSGARMLEVGTTNRTRISDYEGAITASTAALLRVHTSNFRVTGFTENASLAELAELARARGLILLDDLGSGALESVGDEPLVAESLRWADLVTFSGDKLLGGPQAGIALGAAELIAKLERHPLARALRPDKMTLAALEATLLERLRGEAGEQPVQRMLRMPLAELRRRAAWWGVRLGERGVRTHLREAESAAGAGSLPEWGLATVQLAVEGPASRLAAALRQTQPPVLARIDQDLCCLDPRTVLRGEDDALLDAVEVAVSRAGRRPGPQSQQGPEP